MNSFWQELVSNKFKILIIIISLLIIFLLGNILFNKNDLSSNHQELAKPKSQSMVVSVETTKSRLGNFADYTKIAARTEAVQQIKLVARIEENITAVNYQVGDQVAVGDVIIELDSQKAKFAVLNAEAALQSARADLKTAENGPRQQELEKQQAELDKLKSDLKLAEKNYQRKEQLFAEDYISTEELEQAHNQLVAARTAYLSSQKSFELLKLGATTEEITALEAKVKEAEVKLAQAKLEASYCTIKTPINGIVAELNANVGELATNNIVAVITDISQIKLVAYVNELNINKLEQGEAVTIMIPALEKNFTGRIKSIAPTIAAERQSFPVEIIVDNPANLIKAGMSAQLELRTARADNVLLLSQDAILEEAGQHYVYLIKAKTAIRKNIELGLENEEFAVVKAGLQTNQYFATLGKNNLQDGSQVQIVSGSGN